MAAASTASALRAAPGLRPWRLFAGTGGLTGVPRRHFAAPPRSQHLRRRADLEGAQPAVPGEEPKVSATAAAAASVTAGGSTASGSSKVPIVRYGPENVELKPRDQLRPLLPTWNPPPTREAKVEDLKQGTRIRCLHDERWWAATVREELQNDGTIKVGYDGWPSRHDEMVPVSAARLYLHESFHEDYVAPPIPARYQKPIPTDEDGNPAPAAPRAPRPKVFDPEKERVKRALRPPLPYNPEKERLKRQLRGQSVPPVEETISTSMPSTQAPAPAPAAAEARSETAAAAASTQASAQPAAAEAAGSSTAAPSPKPAPAGEFVAWEEIKGGVEGKRAFRHTQSGEVTTRTPSGGWVEILADGNASYYWHPERNITTWDRPK